MSTQSKLNDNLAERANLETDRLQDGASVDEQPESGTSRRTSEIRQSAPDSDRVDDLNTDLQSPEEA